MTPSEEIFWARARSTVRDIGMQHLDPAHGAAVNIVRWCLAGGRRPTHHRQVFLEAESLAILAYLEKLAKSGDVGWRTLDERIRLHAVVLQDMMGRVDPWLHVAFFLYPSRVPLAATWHALPEIAAIGQTILDRQAKLHALALGAMPTVIETNGGTSGDGGEKGGSGKAGSAGTTAKPRPALRLSLPPVPIILTQAEKTTLDLDDVSTDDSEDNTSEGPDVKDGPIGPKPGGRK
ncbi:hypothetical protein [Rhizobium sp. 2TAF27]|uniref:hypothetical protein n=1 Tax=Rhizobium sp. 2TAF27 TaxID=3233013 RepID=UPI003F9E629F